METSFLAFLVFEFFLPPVIKVLLQVVQNEVTLVIKGVVHKISIYVIFMKYPFCLGIFGTLMFLKTKIFFKPKMFFLSLVLISRVLPVGFQEPRSFVLLVHLL